MKHKYFGLGTQSERIPLILEGLDRGLCTLVKGIEENGNEHMGMKLNDGTIYILLDADFKLMVDEGLLVMEN